MLKCRFARYIPRTAAVLFALVLLAPNSSFGQGPGKKPDFIPEGYDDYRNMLDQLGIKKMRNGRMVQRTPPPKPPRTPTRTACPT